MPFTLGEPTLALETTLLTALSLMHELGCPSYAHVRLFHVYISCLNLLESAIRLGPRLRDEHSAISLQGTDDLNRLGVSDDSQAVPL